MVIDTKLIEPEAAELPTLTNTSNVLLYSIAISAKKIADALSSDNVKSIMDIVSNYPTNVYGEGFAAAIQNGIERGMRGISTHGN